MATTGSRAEAGGRSLTDEIRDALGDAGIDNAGQEARWIVEAAAGDSSVASRTHADRAVRDRALALVRRRASGEPLQYVCGVAGFRRLELRVGPGVLIPRPETELLAQRAMELLPRGGTVVDVGTGSGAIALAIADERPDAHVVATDVSEDAVRWARANAERVAGDVRFVVCDLLAGLSPRLHGAIDVIVSNPPYVAFSEAASLPMEVSSHEPGVALFGGETGIEVTGRLVRNARGWLRPGAFLVLEISEVLGAKTEQLLRALGFEQIGIQRDLAGRDRIAEGRRP